MILTLPLGSDPRPNTPATSTKPTMARLARPQRVNANCRRYRIKINATTGASTSRAIKAERVPVIMSATTFNASDSATGASQREARRLANT